MTNITCVYCAKTDCREFKIHKDIFEYVCPFCARSWTIYKGVNNAGQTPSKIDDVSCISK